MSKTVNLKIFYYELKRMLFNRRFLGMLVVNGIFAWFVLTTDIIMGVASTAPFSPWSYGAYLGKVMPMAVLTVLLLLSGTCSKKQKQVELLTSVTPVSLARQIFLRTAVLGVGFVFLCVLIIGISMIFYLSFFGFCSFSAFLLPTLLLTLPCFVFFAGLGEFLGRIHPGLVFGLMLCAFVAGYWGTGGAADLFGAGYFNSRPLTLPVNGEGEPGFVIDAVFGAMRGVYFLLGAVFFVMSMKLSLRKGRRA